jgi:hypothetical protein
MHSHLARAQCSSPTRKIELYMLLLLSMAVLYRSLLVFCLQPVVLITILNWRETKLPVDWCVCANMYNMYAPIDNNSISIL